MARLLLADDHQVVRQGLRALLESQPGFQIVAEAGDGVSAVELTRELKPDVLILDLLMPGISGIEVIHRLREQKILDGIKIVVLSMQSNEAYVHEALQAGAAAYVLKEAGSTELLQAIRAALEGRTYLSPPLSLERLQEYEARTRGGQLNVYETLTRREREVFKLIAEGSSNAEAASVLQISPRTVEVHRANLMNKLGIRNQADLVRLAVEQGLVQIKPPRG